VVDAGGFDGGKEDRRKRFESYSFFSWFKGDGRQENNMTAATETSVAGVGALAVVRRAGQLAGCMGDDLARNQLHARKQEDDYRSDPKDPESRRHSLMLIVSQVCH
jgi:hypothetical protein